MTAVSSEIDPMQLDDLIWSIPEDLRSNVVTPTDRKGRSLGHIAASEAPDPTFLFVLSSYGISLDEEIDKAHAPIMAGQTPLHFAVQREDGWPFVAALLALQQGNRMDKRDRTPFDLVIAKDIIGSEAALLADGKWPDIYAEHFKSAQPRADARCDEFLTAKFFEQARAEDVAACLSDEKQFFAVDHNGNTILHLAAENAADPLVIDQILKSAETPKLLVEKRNSSGNTPLHLVAETGESAEVLLRLLAWGANPNTLASPTDNWVGKKRGLTPLHMAATRKDDLREDMILALLAFGADTMVKDTKEGWTALHRALLDPNPTVLLMLFEGQFQQENLIAAVFRSFTGKSVKQISDDSGRTALHIAASRESDFHTLFQLVVYGFSVDQKDSQGVTPLMFAALNFKDAESFLFLLEQSEKPCGASKTGTTVEAALRSNKVLMAIGADDKSGKTLSPLALFKQRCP